MKKFKTFKGRETDILHSSAYASAKYPMCQAMAFNKPFLNSLSDRDKYLMRGYAQAKVEEMQAFKYKHPDYKRKKGKKINVSTQDIAKHLNNF